MSLFFGRWRFLTNGDNNFVGFFAIVLVCGLIAFGLRLGLLGGLVLNDCGVVVVGVNLLICLCVHR
jgi:hypothetical protein